MEFLSDLIAYVIFDFERTEARLLLKTRFAMAAFDVVYAAVILVIYFFLIDTHIYQIFQEHDAENDPSYIPYPSLRSLYAGIDLIDE